MENKIIDSNYDFEKNNQKYNNEKNFTITIELNKTCYFKGEYIKGNLILKPNDIIKKSLLLCPIIANATLEEIQSYKYYEISTDLVTEKEILFKYPMNVPIFNSKNIIEGMRIPFEYQIPHNSYPSCIFDDNSYVRHILIFDFSSIEAKKSIVIIIKNNQYFSAYNDLFKSPKEVNIKVTKHKYAIFNMGYFSAKVKLEKNVFGYDEVIPLQIEIDCPDLKIEIENVDIFIYLIMSKNNKGNHKKSQIKTEKKIFSKIISLKKKMKKYHLEDIIELPKGNPHEIYKKLDNDTRIYSQKFKNLYLYPCCYDGLISCEYYLKITFETDTLFSTNESLIIPIDFYERDNTNKTNNYTNSNLDIKYLPSEGIFNTPKPFNNKIEKDDIFIKHSNTQNMDKINNIIENNYNFAKNKSFNLNVNNNNLNDLNNQKNESKINNNNNIINNDMEIKNEMITAEKEIESYDAPPSIVHFDPKNN